MSDWKESYRRRYAELKSRGKSFFPFAVYKDVVVAFLIFLALGILAYKLGAKLEDLADPTDNTYNPRPEWYFLFLFQALKSFPGKYEAIAAVVIPGVALGLLAALPFLDRGPKRHPLDRPILTGFGLFVLAGLGYLTWSGLRSPLTNPIVEKNPQAAAGHRRFQELHCEYCHAINGKGGLLAPDLARVASARDEEWLTKHLRDPQSVVPGSVMPRLNLLDEEIADLVAYIKSLGVGEGFTPEAPKLFSENCTVCHKIGSEGGDVGPDLSLIGSARDKAFIRRYISDPTSTNPSATMPGFKGQLTDVQIEDVARFLASHRGP